MSTLIGNVIEGLEQEWGLVIPCQASELYTADPAVVQLDGQAALFCVHALSPHHVQLIGITQNVSANVAVDDLLSGSLFWVQFVGRAAGYACFYPRGYLHNLPDGVQLLGEFEARHAALRKKYAGRVDVEQLEITALPQTQSWAHAIYIEGTGHHLGQVPQTLAEARATRLGGLRPELVVECVREPYGNMPCAFWQYILPQGLSTRDVLRVIKRMEHELGIASATMARFHPEMPHWTNCWKHLG